MKENNQSITPSWNACKDGCSAGKKTSLLFYRKQTRLQVFINISALRGEFKLRVRICTNPENVKNNINLVRTWSLEFRLNEEYCSKTGNEPLNRFRWSSAPRSLSADDVDLYISYSIKYDIFGQKRSTNITHPWTRKHYWSVLWAKQEKKKRKKAVGFMILFVLLKLTPQTLDHKIK